MGVAVAVAAEEEASEVEGSFVLDPLVHETSRIGTGQREEEKGEQAYHWMSHLLWYTTR
jgi:hypothetical protein